MARKSKKKIVSEEKIMPRLNKKILKFKLDDKNIVLKNQIIAWILTINNEMDSFVSNLDNISLEEKMKRVTEFYSTLLVVNKVLDGRSIFYGNQLVSKDFGVDEHFE